MGQSRFYLLKANHTAGGLVFAVKDSLGDKAYMYVGNNIVYIYGDTAIAGNLDVGSIGNNSINTWNRSCYCIC